MNDPGRRILDDPSSGFGSELVRSALGDRPRPEARQNTLRALGLGAGLGVGLTAGEAAAGAAGVKTAAGALPMVLVGKWVAVGVASGALVLGGMMASRQMQKNAPPVAAAVSLTADKPASDPPSPPAISVESLPLAVDSAPRVTVRLPSLPAPPRESAAAEPANSSQPVSLARELALIDEARRALANSDWRGATTALDRHDAEFPRGGLATESLVLRIESLAQRGERGRALALARPFLASHPNSPLARRVRKAIGSEPEQETAR